MSGNLTPTALSAAGFDPGSGAGLSADLKTFTSLGVYGTGLITAITSQNHDFFSRVSPVDPGLFEDQLKMVTTGYRVRCVKTGLLTRETAVILGKWKLENPDIFLVCDPVFTATSGNHFFTKEDAAFLEESLFKHADLITPNLHEASVLTGRDIVTLKDMERAGPLLRGGSERAVLLKGGHLAGEAVDLLLYRGGDMLFTGTRVTGVNTHGSGCILSAAIAAEIAKGRKLSEAVTGARVTINQWMANPSHIEGAGAVLNPVKWRE